MKQLTIEEKAKAYDKALERAKEKYPTCYSPALLEYIFPEFKESKDNRIMKVIRGWIYTRPASFFDNGISKEEILAWLKKQGFEPTYINPSEFDLHLNKLLKQFETLPKEELVSILTFYLNVFKNDGTYKDEENQGEQKPADSYCQENCKGFQETGKCFADGDCKAKRKAKSIYEVKPKFKVGAWICNDMCDVHIASIENGMYYFDEGDGLSITFVDERYHLWTIQDAKDGDVLSYRDGQWIFIYKGKLDDNSFYYHTLYSTIHQDLTINDAGFTLLCDAITPATKEQRDLLFAKMKEAGCMFDFKNKEFKKIKNEITIPFGAKDSELQEAIYNIPKGFHAEIDNDKVVIKKGESLHH